MNDMKKIENTLSLLLDLYDNLLSIAESEREYLVNLDIKNLIKVVELKQYLGLKLRNVEHELKDVLDKYNVENISEFLFIVGRDEDVEDLRVLNGALQEKMMRFNNEMNVNRKITDESVSFYNGLLNIYAELFKTEHGNYEKDASVNIKQELMSVRV